MEFDWKKLEKKYGKDLTELFKKTMRMLTEENVSIGQVVRLGRMLDIEVDGASWTVKFEFRE